MRDFNCLVSVKDLFYIILSNIAHQICNRWGVDRYVVECRGIYVGGGIVGMANKYVDEVEGRRWICIEVYTVLLQMLSNQQLLMPLY